MTIEFNQIIAGFYKANIGKDAIGREVFANVRRKGREWHAEFRYAACGEVCRFAGIWTRKADAFEEVRHVASNHFDW